MYRVFQSIIPGSEGGLSLWRGKTKETPITTPRKRKSPKQRDDLGSQPALQASSRPPSPAPEASPAASPRGSPGNYVGAVSPGKPQDSPPMLSTQEKAAAVGRLALKSRKKSKKPGSPEKNQGNTGGLNRAPSLPLSADPFEPFGQQKRKKGQGKVRVFNGNLGNSPHFPFFVFCSAIWIIRATAGPPRRKPRRGPMTDLRV